MRIWRTYDPDEINSIINNPDVNDLSDLLDATSTIENNVWLLGDGFSCFFMNRNDCSYEVHIGVAKNQRGKNALELSRLAVEYMFTNTDCNKLVGIIPVVNKPAIRFGKWLGFRDGGVKIHKYRDGEIPCRMLILETGQHKCHRP